MKTCDFKENQYLHNSEIKLIKAVKKGYKNAIIELIKTGVNIEIRNEEGYTPLILAIKNGHLDIVKELIFFGANIESGNIFSTPLYYSIQSNNPNIAQILIDSGAKIYTENNIAIKWRTANGIIDVPDHFQTILKSGLYAESIYWGTSDINIYIDEEIKIENTFPRLKYLCNTHGVRRSLFQLDHFPTNIKLKIEAFLEEINVMQYRSPTSYSKTPSIPSGSSMS